MKFLIPRDTSVRMSIMTGFFAGLAVLFGIQAMLQPGYEPLEATVVVEDMQKNETEEPECTTNDECPKPFGICIQSQCELIESAVCRCVKEQEGVLRCTDPHNPKRARHVLCPNGCYGTGPQARCR